MFKNLKINTKLTLMRYPTVYYNIYKFFGKRKDLLVTPNTDIVIEGFPRSANTYAVVAFSLAQKGNVKIAHHLHTPVQLLIAVRWNIPAVVLIRNPIDAVSSLIVREPNIDINIALDAYVEFYKPLLEYKKNLVIAKFEDVVNDFNKIINITNKKFKVNFNRYNKTTDSEILIQKKIRQLNIIDGKKEEGVAIPTEYKEKKKQKLKKEILNSKNIDKALNIFYKFTQE